MELEHRRVIKFLHLKGIKLIEIATELSNMCAHDPYATPSINY
jgi:hypothetical protein